MAFEQTWADIQRFAGETFYRLSGQAFTYEAHAGHLKLSTLDQPVKKSDVERACAAGRPATVTQLKELGLPGPSHIFAILTDPRITV